MSTASFSTTRDGQHSAAPEGPARLSERSRKLRETVRANASHFAEQAVYFAEGFRQAEDEPFRQVRAARAVAHLLENMPVRIRRGEILAGWHPNTHPDEDTQAAIDRANEYLASHGWRGYVSEGHLAPDYPTVLREGLGGIVERLDEAQAGLDPGAPGTPDRLAFFRACRIALQGMQRFIRRYAELAARMGAEAEEGPWTRQLEALRDTCRRIATEPPDTLREAIQLSWFVFLCVALESEPSHNCYGPGRMDQYLYRFYEADRRTGRLDEEETDDLLAQFFIKCNEFEGRSMSSIITVVGGRRPDGSDATNELSFRLLEIADRVRTYFPGIDVSWHKDIDPEFMRRAVALLRNGKGQPSFFNSDVIVRGLLRHGVPFEHAVDHLPSTCTETSVMGRSNPCVAWPYVNIPICLLYALFGGRHPLKDTGEDFPEDVGCGRQGQPPAWLRQIEEAAGPPPRTYRELKDAFLRWVNLAAEGAAARCQHDMRQQAVHRPYPLLSCFIQGCIETGTNFCRGGALYNFIQPEAVGVSNAVDGLAAVRTLVEEEERFTLDQFRRAVADDFEGWDELRSAIRRDCPKHGNDIPEVNELFAKVAGAWCDAIEGRRNFLGGPMLPGFLGWTVWIRYGEDTPATPDGRRAGRPLANSITNCTGVRVRGFPAVVRSAGEFDQSRGLGGITFNVRFQADALAEEKGLEGLKGLIEAAFDLGTYQLQVNVASTATMRAAQQEPEQYADLWVRIGGYLVPFTLLPEKAQEEVIARAEFAM